MELSFNRRSWQYENDTNHRTEYQFNVLAFAIGNDFNRYGLIYVFFLKLFYLSE